MRKLQLVAATYGLAVLALASPALAQPGTWLDVARQGYGDSAQGYYGDARRVAFDNGYREGLKEGEKDGRRRDAFGYQDEGAFRGADRGYHRNFGDRVRYQQMFRSGFIRGYTDGYERFAGSWSRDPYGRNRGPVRQQSPGGYGTYGGGGYGYSPAFQNGVSDGYEKGIEDARDRDSFDPLRHKWYRSGDRGYRGEYGQRAQYENLYRQGFKEGYERGYREAAYRR